MRVKPIDIIKSMYGKISKDSDLVIYHDQFTNEQWTRKNKPESEREKKEPTEKQKKSRSAFKIMHDKTCEWLNANKPSDEHPGGTEEYWKMREEFEIQRRTLPPEKVCSKFNGFVWRKMNGELE